MNVVSIHSVVSIHKPVLLEEVVQQLRAYEGGRFLDCTLGGGGHSEAILRAHPDNVVVAFEKDGRAVKRTSERLKEFSARFSVIQTSFGDGVAQVQGQKFDGILADLGISTDQLKEGRGFSFWDETPLDMRMNEEQPTSALEIVNECSLRQLLRILKEGGVGAEAYRVAEAIINARPLQTTNELAQVVQRATSGKGKKGTHPATVVFQAIRIAVNDEFGEVRKLLQAAPSLMKPHGRCAVIAFHSLEDKEVTHVMRDWSRGDDTPAAWRGARQQEKKALGKLLTREAVVPTEREIQENPSSRSARLRVFEFE